MPINATFPNILQSDSSDCAPACIKMLLSYYGIKGYSLDEVKHQCKLTRNGTSIEKLLAALAYFGAEAEMVITESDQLDELEYPVILMLEQKHFAILYKQNEKGIFYVSDPLHGRLKYTRSELLKKWKIDDKAGILIRTSFKKDINTSQDKQRVEKSDSQDSSLISLFKRVLQFRRGVIQILLIMLLGVGVQIALPFLTQVIVDIGIENNDIGFIYLILFSQVMLFLGSTSMDFLRSWILLNIGIRINIELVNNYVKNLLSQSLIFFDTKKEGDILQRVIDNNRIEQFLTNTTFSLLVSLVTLLVFGAVLFVYSGAIFATFVISTVLLVAWVTFFLRRRKAIDNERFSVSAKNRTELVEIIKGIEDIKINNLETERLSRWDQVQRNFLQIRLKLLKLNQIQAGGSLAINQGKNILITFLSAVQVLSGEMTFGAMLAIQFIVGQLNSPIRDIVSFIQNYQDAQLSLGRISDLEVDDSPSGLQSLPQNHQTLDIGVENISLEIGGTHILKGIDLQMPRGKIIGIVGKSGSGKTSLLKVVMGLLKPTNGSIKLGQHTLSYFDQEQWQGQISAVLQDSHIFSESILYNITLEEEKLLVNYDKLERVIALSCLDDLIASLPFTYYTNIGRGGRKLSRGQMQRILIARAMYKDGSIFVLDEFTSALDPFTEKTVLRNIIDYCKDKTVILVAHKLYLLKDADMVVVFKKGTIVEAGPKEELMRQQGVFYRMSQQQTRLNRL